MARRYVYRVPFVNDRLVRLRMGGYALLCLLQLAFVLFGPDVARIVTKVLLMPALALAVLPVAPPLLLGALAAGWLGDIFLLADGTWFLIGMAAFAAGHLCYIALFARGGRPHVVAILGYAVVWAVMIVLLWPDLGALRLPVAGYSLLLATTAVMSTNAGWRAGLGGALFLISDTMIAMGLADWSRPPAVDFWIMLTYVAAQYLLATGAVHRWPVKR
jgi:uncharacterized membrane protein YhhN